MKSIEIWYNSLDDFHKLLYYGLLKKMIFVLVIVFIVVGLHDYRVFTHPHYYINPFTGQPL